VIEIFREVVTIMIMKQFDKKRKDKCTAYNVRFGAMAAVPPRTILCGKERLYPAGSFVGAATTPSRLDVGCNLRTT